MNINSHDRGTQLPASLLSARCPDYGFDAEINRSTVEKDELRALAFLGCLGLGLAYIVRELGIHCKVIVNQRVHIPNFSRFLVLKALYRRVEP